MTDAAEILSRLRAAGANVVIKDGALQLINATKLTREGISYLRANSASIVAALDDERMAFEERAAIIEFDGKTPRQWAEAFAQILAASKPAGVAEVDWTWFLTTCGRMIDEAPKGQAA